MDNQPPTLPDCLARFKRMVDEDIVPRRTVIDACRNKGIDPGDVELLVQYINATTGESFQVDPPTATPTGGDVLAKYKKNVKMGIPYRGVLTNMLHTGVDQRSIDDFVRWYHEETGQLPDPAWGVSYNLEKPAPVELPESLAHLEARIVETPVRETKAKLQRRLEGIILEVARQGHTDAELETLKDYIFQKTGVEAALPTPISDAELDEFRRKARAGVPIPAVLNSFRALPLADPQLVAAFEAELNGTGPKVAVNAHSSGDSPTSKHLDPRDQLVAVLQDPAVVDSIMKRGGDPLTTTKMGRMVDPLVQHPAALDAISRFQHQQSNANDARQQLIRVKQDRATRSPLPLNIAVVQDVFLDAHAFYADDQSWQNLDAFLSVAKDALPNPPSVQCLENAMVFLEAMHIAGGDHSKQVALFQESIVLFTGSPDTGNTAILPLGFVGEDGRFGAFTLVVEKLVDQTNRFNVTVCSKHNCKYHGQTVDDENGTLLVCPTLTLPAVPGERLLVPAFATMALRLAYTHSKWNKHKVLYEVLVPFLNQGNPIHKTYPENFRAAHPGAWWGKPGRAPSSSRIAGIMVTLRFLWHRQGQLTTARWKAFKLDVKHRIALHVLRDTSCHVRDPTNLLSAAAQAVARGCLKLKRALASPGPSDLEPLLQQAQATALELDAAGKQSDEYHNKHGRDANVRYSVSFAGRDWAELARVWTATTGIQDQARVEAARDKLATSTSINSAGVLVRRFLRCAAAGGSELESITTLRDACEELYHTNEFVVLQCIIQHAVGLCFPSSLESWRDSNVWGTSSDAQPHAIAALSRVALLYFEASITLGDSEYSLGNRMVVLGYLYAAAVAITLNAQGTCAVSVALREIAAEQGEQQSTITFGVDGRSLNQASFNESTGILPLSADLVGVRSSLVSFFETPCSRGGLLWDLSKLGSHRTSSDDVTLQLAGRVGGVSDLSNVVLCCEAFCAHKLDTGEFADLRDLAALFKYASVPDPVGRSQDAFPLELSWKSVAWQLAGADTHLEFAGEYVSHGKAVQHRHIQDQTDPGAFCSSEVTSTVITETDIIHLADVPTFDQFLSPEESERLLCFLTQPYVRVPAVLSFFGSHVSALFHPSLMGLLRQALLQPQALVTPASSHGELQPPMPPGGLTCPNRSSDRRVREMSLLYEEIHDGPTVNLFLGLFTAVMEQCQTAAAPSGDMLRTLDGLVDIYAAMEGVARLGGETNVIDSLTAYVRGVVVQYLEEHKRYSTCVHAFRFAPPSDMQANFRRILNWAMLASFHRPAPGSSDSPSKGPGPTHVRLEQLRIQQVLMRLFHCNVELSSAEINQLVLVFEATPINAKWSLNTSTGCYTFNSFAFDPITARIEILGTKADVTVPNHARQNKQVQQLMGMARSPAHVKVVDPTTYADVAPHVDACLVVDLPSASLMQVCVHKEPLLRQVGTETQVVTACIAETFTTFVANAGPGQPTTGQVAVPIHSSRPRSSTFEVSPDITWGDLLASANVTATRRRHSGGPLEILLPACLLAAYLPAHFMSGYTFWLSQDAGTVHGECARDRGLDIIVALETGAISQGGRTLVACPPIALTRCLVNVEDLGHVLCWTGEHVRQGRVSLIELPRMNVSFLPTDASSRGETASDEFCLADNPEYLLDLSRHAQVATSAPVTQGLQFFLTLVTKGGTENILVPHRLSLAWDQGTAGPNGTAVAEVPASKSPDLTENCIVDRGATIIQLCPSRDTFTATSRLAALLLFVHKLCAREYRHAHELINMIASDNRFTDKERLVFDAIESTDMHPEACVCRLKLYEATCLRSGEKPSTGARVLREICHVLQVESHVTPTMRLDGAFLTALLEHAVEQGQKLPTKYCSAPVFVDEHIKLPNLKRDLPPKLDLNGRPIKVEKPQFVVPTVTFTDMAKTTVEVRLALARGSAFPVPVPHHCGGGWAQMKTLLREDYMEHFKMYTPRFFTDTLKSLEPQDVATWVTEMLDAYTPDASLPTILRLVQSAEQDERQGFNQLALAELLGLQLYLQRQNLQGTNFWESTSFHLLAMVCNGVSLPMLPPVPKHAVDLRKYPLKVCGLLEAVTRWPGFVEKATPFKLELCERFVATRAMPKPDNSWVSLRTDGDELRGCDRPVARQPLKTWKMYSSIVAKSSKKPADAGFGPSKQEGEGEKVLFDKLQHHDALDRFPAGTELVERIKRDTKLFDKLQKALAAKPLMTVCSDPDTLTRGLAELRAEMDGLRRTMLKLMQQTVVCANAQFSLLSRVAGFAPTFEFTDLMRMIVSKAGQAFAQKHKIPCDDIVDVLITATSLQQFGRAFVALEATLHAPAGDNSPEREFLLECLNVGRFHDMDPRMLVFEYESGYLLRETQVKLVNEYTRKAEAGECGSRQMKMGEGKSSVIFPLLSLSLAKGDALTVLAVPPYLVEMSQEMMVRALGLTFNRRIVSFQFTRDTISPDMKYALRTAGKLLRKLRQARDTGAVVLTTSSAIKSFLLKVVELFRMLPSTAEAETLKDLLAKMSQLFVASTLLLDECDVSFHPLKSELNFPVGLKQDLSRREWRVSIAKRLLDTLFSETCSSVVKRGVDSSCLEASPHLTLASRGFYMDELVQPLAKTLAESLIKQCASVDANLSVLTGLRSSQYKASTSLNERHELDNVFTDHDSFWCSKERPKSATIDIKLVYPDKRTTLGCVRIEHRPYSSFQMRSGLNMIPSTVVLSLSFDNGHTYEEWVTCGEFVSRRFLVPESGESRPPPTHLRIAMSGAAQWFAVQRINLMVKPTDAPNWDAADQRDRVQVLQDVLMGKNDLNSLKHVGFNDGNLQLVGLAQEYVLYFLPHCLSKTNSVSYGLVQSLDGDQVRVAESGVRRYLAVPFVGKDTPSPASEFSHPDVLILLSLLSYRHGGLREMDVVKLVSTLQLQLGSQVGTLQERPAFAVFNRLISKSQGGGRRGTEGRGAATNENVRGLATNEHTLPTDSGPLTDTEEGSSILPLHLFQTTDQDAVHTLWKLIRHQSFAIDYYCTNIAFPLSLKQRPYKLSATGEELLLQCQHSVLGMSGTPSASVPLRMGQCEWEAGTEGQFLRTLSRERYVSVGKPLGKHWTPTSLLTRVAKLKGVCALIDTGALVTGLSNEDVAKYLLCVPDGLPEHIHGVVYLDPSDRKMVLTKATTAQGITSFHRTPLESSPIPPSQRFTFFDQVHTTGMDIPQPAAGKAVVTVGKDMTFRDFAQGAYRMRRLGKGQTLLILFPPTVEKLATENFPPADAPNILPAQRINLFLLVNTLVDLQGQQEVLQKGRLSTVWRKPTVDALALNRNSTAVSDDVTGVFVTKVSHEKDEAGEVSEDSLSLSELVSKYAAHIKTAEQRHQVGMIVNGTSGGGDAVWGEKKQAPKAGKLTKVKRFVRRLMFFRNAKLDAEQQEQQVHGVSGLGGEQQQEKEKEQQVDVGSRTFTQPRAWRRERLEAGSFQFDGTGASLGDDGHFLQLRDIALFGGGETKESLRQVKLEGVRLSLNHSASEPQNNSRLHNIEVALRRKRDGHVFVLSLEEAATVRWMMLGRRIGDDEVELILVEDGQRLTGRGGDVGGLEKGVADPRLQVLRFFNSNTEFSAEQLAALSGVLEDVPPVTLAHFYASAKRMRRRVLEPGYETSEKSVLRGLLSL